jgi:HEAT repeat protein
MKIILYFIFSMILILANHTVLAEQTQDCTNRSSGSEKRCLTGKKKDKGSNSKSYVLQLLKSLAEQRAIPSITPLLQDSEPYVRDAAIEILGQLGAKEAIPSIIPLLQDTDSSVRNKAIKALVQFRTKEAIPSIIPLLQEKDSKVRISAVLVQRDLDLALL